MHTLVILFAWLFVTTPFASQTASTAPNPSAPIIDNERVVVWELDGNGQPPRDAGNGNLEALEIALAEPEGRVIFHTRRPGGAPAESPLSGRRIVIDLKDHPVPPLANTSGYPNAFPRPGIKKVLENPRIIVWDYTWTPGVPTPMHFHNTDVVVVFLHAGDLRSTTPNGEQVVNSYAAGTTRFNSRNRTHNEELIKGTQRAIIVELK